MNIAFKNVYNFSLFKSSMGRQRVREIEKVSDERVICGIALFSFSIGHWLASSNFIRKEEKKKLKRVFLCSLFSIKCIVYGVEVEVEVVVSRSAPSLSSLLDSCVSSNYI